MLHGATSQWLVLISRAKLSLVLSLYGLGYPPHNVHLLLLLVLLLLLLLVLLLLMLLLLLLVLLLPLTPTNTATALCVFLCCVSS